MASSSTSGSAAGAGVGTDCEGEEQDEPSSSSDITEGLQQLSVEDDPQKETEDELSLFRHQWQRELEGNTPSPQREPTSKTEAQEVQEPLTDEEMAKQLFLRGVEMERGGKLYEAIQHYKRAMQMDPDVERRIYESEMRTDTPDVVQEAEPIERVEICSLSEDEEALEGEDLLTRLQRLVARRGQLCQQENNTRGAHISWLPYEVILLILRWVVSSDLDAVSLERLAATSRGFYVAARENHVWRDMCVRTWGLDCGTPRAHGFISWRQMYIERPRLQLNGCYISKTTYLRHGENSFQDQFYRPWYLIDYYRYLRFFPEGVVLMWTTAEEPASCVGQLRSRTPKPGLGIMAGHYRLVGNKVVIVIKKERNEKKQAQTSNTRFRARKRDSNESHEHTFHMELELRTVRSRRNFQLCWSGYAVSTRRDQWTPLDLPPAKFPPFCFSRVRTYTALALAPLAYASHSS